MERRPRDVHDGSLLRRLSRKLSSSARLARARLATKRGRRALLVLIWLAMWLVGLATFGNHQIDEVADCTYRPAVCGMLWLVSVFTTASLGKSNPRETPASFLWAAAFIAIGVPLTVAVYASVVDVYISHVERREVRCRRRRSRAWSQLVCTHASSHDL